MDCGRQEGGRRGGECGGMHAKPPHNAVTRRTQAIEPMPLLPLRACVARGGASFGMAFRVKHPSVREFVSR